LLAAKLASESIRKLNPIDKPTIAVFAVGIFAMKSLLLRNRSVADSKFVAIGTVYICLISVGGGDGESLG